MWRHKSEAKLDPTTPCTELEFFQYHCLCGDGSGLPANNAKPCGRNTWTRVIRIPALHGQGGRRVFCECGAAYDVIILEMTTENGKERQNGRI